MFYRNYYGIAHSAAEGFGAVRPYNTPEKILCKINDIILILRMFGVNLPSLACIESLVFEI